MAPLISIKLDERGLRRLERRMRAFPKAMNRIVPRAINKTLTATKVVAANQISTKTGIKKTVAKRGIKKTVARFTRWVGSLHFSGRRIPVARLEARQTNKGVTFRSTKTRQRILIKSAFKAVMPKARVNQKAGHLGVFERRIEGGKFKPYDGRLPLEQNYGPSIKHIFKDSPVIIAATVRKAVSTLTKEVTRQVNLVFEGAR